MRQVSYQRPKDFVDPYADETPPVLDERSIILERRQFAKSSAQIHRLKTMKSTGSAGLSPLASFEQHSKEKEKFLRASSTDSIGSDSSNGKKKLMREKSRESFEASSKYPPNSGMVRNSGSSVGDQSWVEWGEENVDGGNLGLNDFLKAGNSLYDGSSSTVLDGVELGQIERLIKVIDPSISFQPPSSPSIPSTYPSEPLVTENSYEIMADIRCWLVDNELIVITMRAVQGAHLEAEAEVDLAQLLAIKGLDIVMVSENPVLLTAYCQEILETVELRIEDSVPRLMLILQSSNLADSSTASENDFNSYSSVNNENVLIDGNSLQKEISSTMNGMTSIILHMLFCKFLLIYVFCALN